MHSEHLRSIVCRDGLRRSTDVQQRLPELAFTDRVETIHVSRESLELFTRLV
jgi:hypothetical protein